MHSLIPSSPLQGRRARSALLLIVSLLLGGSLAASVASAQVTVPSYESRPDLYVRVADSLVLCRISGSGDTVDAADFSQAYIFEMLADTTSVTRYTFSDTRHNGARVHLAPWDYKRRVTTSANLLSLNSRTRTMHIKPGDTLQFFRELYWYNPMTRQQRVDGYRSFDTLGYSVELVRARDGARLALLDSIGTMPRVEHGVPVVFGMRPIIAVVQYVIPSAMTGTQGDSAYLRVQLFDRGDGEFFFDRTDAVRIGLSRKLESSYWQTYLAQWGTVLGKRPESDAGAISDARAELEVGQIVGAPGELNISFNAAPDGAATSIVVYDALGKPVFYPYTTPFSPESPSGERRAVRYTAPVSGLYMVALFYNGTLVNAKPVTVTR